MKKVFFILLTILTFKTKSQTCNASSLTPSNIYYTGPSYNITTSTFTTMPIRFLCNNAIVYDTLVGGDLIVMISSGAQYTWRPCGPALSNIYVKSGGILNFKQGGCGTAKNIFIEPGALINDPYGVMAAFTATNSCASIAFPAISCSSGIDEKTENTALLLFPCPTNGLFSLEFLKDFEIMKGTEIKIKTLLAEEIERIQVQNTKQNLDLSTLKDGIYILQLFQDNKLIASRKIIKH